MHRYACQVFLPMDLQENSGEKKITESLVNLYEKVIYMCEEEMTVTYGVYASGRTVRNVVRNEDLQAHKEYNRVMRFGRMHVVFVDGKATLAHHGYFTDEECKEWLVKLEEMEKKHPPPTIPSYLYK
jgi:hypothetical protein